MRKDSLRDALAWAAVLLAAAAALILREQTARLSQFGDFNREIVGATNAVIEWFIGNFKWLFNAVSTVLEWPLFWLQSLLHWLPWSVTVTAFAALACAAGGWRLAVFAVASLMYIVLTGYWHEGMNTLALVGASVPLAAAIGFWIGVWGYRSKRAERIIQPCLDLMQTVPTFAYLIPILLLFGFGPVVGLIAGIIYACPPMVRNTMHGLRRIPPVIIESALMSGAAKRQRFWWVEVPSALPQIMIGLNQTTMAALAMVIIAAIIGGFDDIGWEVLSTMRKAQFGQSLLSGMVIVLLAMLIDRISAGFAKRERLFHATDRRGVFWRRHALLLGACLAVLTVAVASMLLPFLNQSPDGWRLPAAERINRALGYVVINFGDALEQIKIIANFYFLLPIKIGLLGAVRPESWGVEFTVAKQAFYWLGGGALCALLLWRAGWRSAVTALIMCAIFFYGLSNIPWTVFLAIITLVAWQAGGRPVAAFAALSMLFIQFAGVWQQAMLSVYLCGAAVIFSFIIGGAIGVWAALNERVSRVIRPINDTLQTMPQFVYLIPVLFLFQIGDFSALIAVIGYAIVPMIRYTEHGIRNISPTAIEVSRVSGCTRRQILFEVQLPMALPEIMLGLNQTIMFGLAMLVIAALVGTRGLGQSVYIALGQADAGRGLVAGVSIALIAMVADRIIQAWAKKQKARLGGASETAIA